MGVDASAWALFKTPPSPPSLTRRVQKEARIQAAMTRDQIRACLAQDGWPVEEVSDTTLRSGFRGKTRIFPVIVHVTKSTVSFAIVPYVHAPEEPDMADELFRKLLHYNREMNLAKFSVDEDDDVVLSVEYRLRDLDPSEVRDAIDVISFYADKLYGEVERLAGS